MQFTCARPELSKAIATVSHAVAKQQTILDSILFEARDGDKVTLRATDNNLAISTVIPARVETGGRIAVPHKILADFVNRLPDADATMTQVSETMVEIKCLTAKGRLQLMNQEEFPTFPRVQKNLELRMPADQLADMVNRTIFAASTGTDRPILTGVLFHVQPEKLTLVALDGYRMAIREEAVQSEKEGQFVVPAQALREMSRTVSDDGDITVSFDQSRVMLETQSTRITAQLLEGEYVPYDSYFPKTFSIRVQLEKSALLESIERAYIIAEQSGESRVVQLVLTDNVLDVRANAQTASSNEPLPVIMRGEDLTIAFNAKYLLDVLKAIDDTEITMTFNTSTTPCAVERTGAQAYRYLLLPVLTQNVRYQ